MGDYFNAYRFTNSRENGYIEAYGKPPPRSFKLASLRWIAVASITATRVLPESGYNKAGEEAMLDRVFSCADVATNIALVGRPLRPVLSSITPSYACNYFDAIVACCDNELRALGWSPSHDNELLHTDEDGWQTQAPTSPMNAPRPADQHEKGKLTSHLPPDWSPSLQLKEIGAKLGIAPRGLLEKCNRLGYVIEKISRKTYRLDINTLPKTLQKQFRNGI